MTYAIVLPLLLVSCAGGDGEEGDTGTDTVGDLVDEVEDTSPDTAADTDTDTETDAAEDVDVEIPDADVAGSLTVDLSFPAVEMARGVYVWVEDGSGAYVDTVEQYFGDPTPTGELFYEISGVRWMNDRPDAWRMSAGESPLGPLVVDGVTGATTMALDMGDYTTASWDCLDATGSPIPAGVYTVRVEITFDDMDHSPLPSHTYSGSIMLGAGDSSADIWPSDEKVSVATASFVQD